MNHRISRGTQRVSSRSSAFEHLAQQPRLVLGIQDLEALRQTRLAPVQAQQPVREPVEGADPHGAAGNAEQRLDARRAFRPAALLVKVTARMLFGEAPSTWISQATRCTSTRVLPLPAPASTRAAPSGERHRLALRVVEADRGDAIRP